jgi:tetratricopeptide (TPR) repeat protein
MRTCRWIGRAVVATAFVLGAPRPSAAADEPAPISAEDNAKAIKFLAEGNKAFKVGRFAEAEAAYEKAFALKRVYDIAGNLGMTEFVQTKHREAAEHLAFGLRLFPITGDPGQRDQMQKWLDQCKKAVGTVKVNVNVRGALVYVDTKLVGETPLLDDVYLDPGEHTLEAKADGYKPMSQKVQADKGSALQATFNLAQLPKPKGKTVFIEVPGKRRSIVPAIVVGAGAVVAAVVGGVLFAVSLEKQNDAEDASKQIGLSKCLGGGGNRPDCIKLLNDARNVDTFHNISIGTFVGAGVLAAGAVTYLLWPSSKTRPSPRQGIQVAPTVGAGQGGLLVSGAF